MGFSLSGFFRQNRDVIIETWVDRLNSEVGDQYTARPREELMDTVTAAYDANIRAIIDDDLRQIDAFINRITKMRLETGFKLSDVQQAFELFRSITVPLLALETELDAFSTAVVRLNRCLKYTIHRFSDYFQAMHEKKILEHNRRLEAEVKERTAALRESERKYKTLVEEINDGYFVVQKGVIVFANQAFCDMHGYQPKEVIGQKVHTFVAPQSLRTVIERYTGSGEKNADSHTFEYLRLTKDRREYPTEILSKNTVYDGRLSSIGICRDITERVKMEKKVHESERMAYIGQITTSLSHEIRNPLSAVKMSLQILKKNPQIRGNDQRRIDISISEVKQLERILQELLDFAKPLQLKPGSTQVNRILAASIDLLEMKFREENMVVVTHLDNDLPEIRADGEKLHQAFINVLLNALEASPYGSTIEIRSGFDPDNGGFARVTIADEGDGVSESHFSEIFKPFFTTKSSGTGLGLSNARRIIEAHCGRIDVENRQPSGAFFNVRLPVA